MLLALRVSKLFEFGALDEAPVYLITAPVWRYG